MLKITKLTDYGFILLVHMVRDKEVQLHNAKDLSATSRLALPTVSKVLKMLTQGNILKSHQGSKGGYSLDRSAEQITAAEVIEAIEGPLAITDCNSEEGCTRGGCLVSPSWKQLNDTLAVALKDLTLADMANGGK